jgi:two-component system chemotaxis sensor kinase CheA
MSQKNDSILQKLLETFQIEAREHIQAMSAGLIELEKTAPADKQMDIVETIFREAHSLKGASRAVNLVEMETICGSLESVFAALKRKETVLSPPLFDLFHKAIDSLSGFLSSIGTGPASGEQPQIGELVQELERTLKGGFAQPRREEAKAKSESKPPADPDEETIRVPAEPMASTETIRISAAKLDTLFLQAEALLSAKLAGRQRTTQLRAITSMVAGWRQEWSDILPELPPVALPSEANTKRNGNRHEGPQERRLAEFLGRGNTVAKSLEAQLTKLAQSAERDQRALGSMVDNLLDDMKKVLMLPLASLLEIFPKIVRDLSRDQGKEAEWLVRGAEIEMDRRILGEIKDPLIHLVRNCIDHGIEKPEERVRKGKPPRGTVSLAVTQKNGNKVEVLIADDGSGVDSAKVRAVAVKLGVVSAEQAQKLDERQILPLVFHSGVSTSPIITDISGRGLGLAIVREKVERLGGTVSLETRPGLGTSFRIVLPLTLATFRGVLVRLKERHFVLPTTNVERVGRVSRQEIKTVENRETIELHGQAVSLVRLESVLELPRQNSPEESFEKIPILVISLGAKRIAFVVDEILNEQEVLVKGLGPQLSRVRNIAGATVLGGGQVVPILSVGDLMKAAERASATHAAGATAVKEENQKAKSILVAEDSITARTLLKNVLESAGYDVKTAVDGADAFTVLRTAEFDLIVSDVEMPRISGLDLTAKIRADKRLSAVPVVLVTALESREDRERGIDVGANAYIVKSSFDQSNLLEVIRRLI